MAKQLSPPKFSLGIDMLLSQHGSWLQGERVALLSHQAAVCGNGATSAQQLHRALGRGLVALFGPEHGFMGQAGAGVVTHTRRHPDWGIPVYSLYGTCRKPTPAMLRGVDVVVCDLKDLGARCYTYLATLRNMLEAAAESGVRVIVTDRPVPLPQIVDGPMLEPAHQSFVGPAEMPLATGLTQAEAALWLVKTLGLTVDLQVVPMQGYGRECGPVAGWPEFLAPSPGIRTWESGMTYLTTVFTEALPGIDVGRGTTLSFRTLGAPWLRAESFCARINDCGLKGVRFHPHRYEAGIAPYAGRELDGVRITVTEPSSFAPVTTSVHVLHMLTEMYGSSRIWRHKGVRPQWFDQLYGTDTVRKALVRGTTPHEICASWKTAGYKRYCASRRKVLLYAAR